MRCAVVWRVASGPGVGTRVRMELHWSRVGTEPAQCLAQLCYFSFRTLAGFSFGLEPDFSFLPGFGFGLEPGFSFLPGFGFGLEPGFSFLPGFGFTCGALRSSGEHRALCVAPS